MAEGLLRARLPEINIISAGISALVGQPAESSACELLNASGIDISGHKAQQIAGWMCEQADLILVMDREQRRFVERLFPSISGKVFRIGEYGNFDVADPYRMGSHAFSVSLSSIERGVHDWVRRIETINNVTTVMHGSQ